MSGGTFAQFGVWWALERSPGSSISYGLTAYCPSAITHGPIPLEEIREFTEVFGAIKANYVEAGRGSQA